MRAATNIKVILLEENELNETAAIKNDGHAAWYVLSAPPKPNVPLAWSAVNAKSEYIVVPLYKLRAKQSDLVAFGVTVGSQLWEDITDVRIIWGQRDDGTVAVGVAVK